MIDYSPLLPRILSNYALDIVHHEHLRTSENTVVKLLAENGQTYALRIRKIAGPGHRQTVSELVVLRDFREHSHADLPAPVATREGQLFCSLSIGGDDYMCVVFSWVAGVHVGARDIALPHMVSMARAVSRLHRFSAAYHPPEGFVRPVYDLEWFFGGKSWSANPAFVERLPPPAAGYLRAANDAVLDRLRHYPRTPASFGLIHYDLHVGNFLFHGTGANMIDFDECGFGYYLFDLAHILFEFIDHPRFSEFREAALGQYAEGRPGGRVPADDLGLFLALQGIAYANWLHRLFRRDGREDALEYWVPTLVRRIQAVWE